MMNNKITHITLFFIILLFNFSVWADAEPIKDKKQVIKEASAQLNYLYKNNEMATTKPKDKWYVYFVGASLNDLKYVINKSNKKFAKSYLKRLNESLIKINTHKDSTATVYVAFTDYEQIFNTPVFSDDLKTEALKIAYIEQLIKKNAKTNEYNIDSLHKARLGYKKYREELKKLIVDIYDISDLSKSKKPNIIMPFTNYTIRNILKPNRVYEEKTIFSYTLYTPKLEEKIVKGHFNKIYKESLKSFNEQGFTSSEKKMLAAVSALHTWYHGVKPPYQECEELLVEYKNSPLMQHSALKQAITENPCVLKNLIPIGDSVPKSKWMEELEYAIAVVLYTAMSIPAAAVMGPQAVTELVKQYGVDKARELAIAVAINITIQAVINYYWHEDVANIPKDNERWKQALINVNEISVAKDAVEVIFKLDGNLKQQIALDCLEGAIEDNNKDWRNLDFSNFQVKPEKCVRNVGVNLVTRPVFKSVGTAFKHLKTLVKSDPKKFVEGWRKMVDDMPKELRQDFVDYLQNLSELVEFDINNIYILSTIDVEEAFNDAISEYAEELNAKAAQQFSHTLKEAATESTMLIKEAIPKVLADNTSKLITKLGANINLEFSIDNVPVNIKASLLEKLEDGTYRLIFVNTSTDNAVEKFLNSTTTNRKKVIDALKDNQANFSAKAIGNNADVLQIKGDDITIAEVELRTPKANTDDFDSEVIVSKKLANTVDSYAKNLIRYKKLFKEGKIKDLFYELKKTTAFPKMGKTRRLNHNDLYTSYKKNYPTYDNYPYSKTHPVTEFELEETAYFIRVFSGDGKASSWVFRLEDLRKYKNAEELLDKLAIPYGKPFGVKPNKIALVEIPAGTKLKKSVAGKQVWKLDSGNLNQTGGGVQYEVLKLDRNKHNSWFEEIEGGLNEIFK